LGTHVSDNVTKWLRISDISASSREDYHLPWTICCSTPQPTDIQQGELGNCWLMAALALITERPHMLRHILLTQKINREGVYLVRICHNGLWKTIILDDCFPCTNHNTLAFSKATKCQLYVPLIEKACAKLFGSYSNLRSGSTAEGLQLLTGAPSDRIGLNPFNEEVDSDVIWAKLLSACESK
jgi:calpain-15